MTGEAMDPPEMEEGTWPGQEEGRMNVNKV